MEDVWLENVWSQGPGASTPSQSMVAADQGGAPVKAVAPGGRSTATTPPAAPGPPPSVDRGVQGVAHGRAESLDD
jgi:hypothetical protein